MKGCWRTNLLSDNGPPITFIITLEWQIACAFTLKRLLSTNWHETIINSRLCLIYLLSSIHSPFSVFLWFFRLTEIPRNAVDGIKENLYILFIEIIHHNLEIHRHVNSLNLVCLRGKLTLRIKFGKIMNSITWLDYHWENNQICNRIYEHLMIDELSIWQRQVH